MKRILKSFTFWLALISIFTIIYNISGNDDKNLIFGLSNPLLSLKIVYIESIRPILVNDDSNASGTVFLYIVHFLMYVVTGLILDFIKNKLKK